MRIRWSFFARLSAIVALGLFAVQLLFIWAFVSNHGSEGASGYRFPLPERVAATVELLEAAPDPERLLVALNGPDLSVFLTDMPIDAFEQEELRLPGVERLLQDYSEQIGDRRFAAYVAAPLAIPRAELRRRARTVLSRYPIRLAVELDTGATLVMESRDDVASQVFSLRIGLFAGVGAVVSAVIVLIVLRRETAPLRRLSDAVEAFARDGKPQPVVPRGAIELQHLTERFNAMQQQVHALLAARTVMLGALGHDLRTYLARMRLRVDALPDAQARRALEADVETMAAVLDNCLSMARDQADRPAQERLDLAVLLPSLVARFGGGKVRFVAAAAGPSRVRFDPLALERVLGNLIDNALKFAGGCEVHLEPVAGGFAIAVSDTGPGFSAEDRAAAFEPFRRGDAARTLGKRGTGLGLPIARQLVEQNGGSIALDTAEGGHGARVTVTIPGAA